MLVVLVPFWDMHDCMRAMALSTLKRFWEDDPACRDVEERAKAWFRHVIKAERLRVAELLALCDPVLILAVGALVLTMDGNRRRNGHDPRPDSSPEGHARHAPPVVGLVTLPTRQILLAGISRQRECSWMMSTSFAI